MSAESSPHYVDLHVGSRLRLRRKTLRLSQGFVAQAVGLTFQQLQKYERGANRISASKLFAIAGVLQVSTSWFFEGLADPMAGETPISQAAEARARSTQAFLMCPEGPELARLFPTVPKSARRQILDLIQALGDEAAEA